MYKLTQVSRSFSQYSPTEYMTHEGILLAIIVVLSVTVFALVIHTINRGK